MKQTRLLMGMPISVELTGIDADERLVDEVFDYFKYVDGKYSTYKPDSEISKINRGLPRDSWSEEMRQVMELCEQTKRQTHGYFDIKRDGELDPSGLVKGWAIQNAAKLLRDRGVRNFYIDAGGDVQVCGHNDSGQSWNIGVRNPFDRTEIIKIISVTDKGVATSGTAIRGQHIYNPLSPGMGITEVLSLTVIGPDIYNADRFATAAFAMGKKGLGFIESLPGYEAYMVTSDKTALLTGGFGRYEAAGA